MASEDDELDIPAAPQKTPKVLLIAALLNLVGTGVVAAKVTSLPDPVTVVAAPVEGAEITDSKAPGPIHALEPLTVNLNEVKGTRYLKTTVELEFVSEDAMNQMVTMNKIIRDDLLGYLSGLSYKETIGEEARNTVQERIAERVNAVMEMQAVRRVLFADFVVQ